VFDNFFKHYSCLQDFQLYHYSTTSENYSITNALYKL